MSDGNVAKKSPQNGIPLDQLIGFLAIVLAIIALFLRRKFSHPQPSNSNKLESPAMDVLPDEAIVHIFAFLSVEEVNQCTKTCWRFNRLSQGKST